MLARTPLVATIFLFAAVGAVACGAGQLVCSGGARALAEGCFCPLGTTWDGATCAGTPQQGACQPGAMQVENQCFCPDGFAWADQTMSSCVALQCGGGSVVAQNECVCPDGRVWIDDMCQVSCIPGAVRTDPNTCVCPEGTENHGDIFGCQAIEVAGPVFQSQPQGPPQSGGPTEQHMVIQQSTQNLTCCINGANYTCPSLDAENRCMKLDPSLCTRAGGC